MLMVFNGGRRARERWQRDVQIAGSVGLHVCQEPKSLQLVPEPY